MKEYIDKAAQAYNLINSGNIDEAIRLSGENLAQVDNLLRRRFNAREEISENIDAFAIAADAHIMSLIAAQEFIQAYSLTLLTLIQLHGLNDFASTSIEKGRFKLLFTLMNLNESISQTIEDDEQYINHANKIIEYSFSLFKETVERLRKVSPRMADIEFADRIINQAEKIFVIQHPLVTVNGKKVNVSEDPTEIYADIAGRARALGWLIIES